LTVLKFLDMIQRIQSVYLFLTTLVSLLFLSGSSLRFINNSGSSFNIAFNGIVKASEGKGLEVVESVWPLTLALILIAALALITIFLYKNRKQQLILAKLLIGLVVILILIACYYAYMIITKYTVTIVPGFKIVLPPVMLIFSILAHRGISKDDKLVKSYDRLR
jgi:hypothetical protein